MLTFILVISCLTTSNLPWFMDLTIQVQSKETTNDWWGPCTKIMKGLFLFSSVQSLSHVQLFATPRTAACQASLSLTNSQSLLKLMSIKSVMPSSYLILCHPLLLLPPIFPRIRVFSSESVFASGDQSIGISFLPMNIQDCLPLGLTCLISLQSKGLPRVFSNTTVQKHQFFGD